MTSTNRRCAFFIGAHSVEDAAQIEQADSSSDDGRRVELDLSCLDASPDGETIVSIDFGTAYSKAALWRSTDEQPTPLELGTAATGVKGLLLDSTIYIGSADECLYFGAEAIAASLREDSATRRRFESPKQELSIGGVERLFAKVDSAIDPTSTFTNGDLLTLYMGYLSVATSSQLQSLGVQRHALRRFAVPVWSAAQVEETSRIIKQMLIDGQILADSTPPEVWQRGMKVTEAQILLRGLRKVLPPNDARRDSVKFVERHVLEASAAAAAIGQELKNRRPVALVMDVGAGTTDIGIYYFVFPDVHSGIHPKIAPFRNGATAKKIAGDRLDKLLIDFVKTSSGLDDADPVLFRLRRDIRPKKRDFFLSGTLIVDGLEDVQFSLAEFLASSPVRSYREALRQLVYDVVKEIGVGNVLAGDGLFAVITGGGSEAPIFRDFFDEPLQIDGQAVNFRSLHVAPGWLDALDPTYLAIFPQLAVALGACSPELPDEKRAITVPSNSAAVVIGLSPVYRS